MKFSGSLSRRLETSPKPRARDYTAETADNKIGDQEPPRTREEFNLRRIADLMDEKIPDHQFRENLPQIRALLPAEFDKLVGLHQRAPHQGKDPLEHTFAALKKLETKDLAGAERTIARVALLYHDLGKIKDPYDLEHPRTSAAVSKKYVDRMGYDLRTSDRITEQIRYHDALGSFAQAGLSLEQVVTTFPTESDLRIHHAIISADISSIPGLKVNISRITALYNGARNTVKTAEFLGRGELDTDSETLLSPEEKEKALTEGLNLFTNSSRHSLSKKEVFVTVDEKTYFIRPEFQSTHHEQSKQDIADALSLMATGREEVLAETDPSKRKKIAQAARIAAYGFALGALGAREADVSFRALKMIGAEYHPEEHEEMIELYHQADSKRKDTDRIEHPLEKHFGIKVDVKEEFEEAIILLQYTEACWRGDLDTALEKAKLIEDKVYFATHLTDKQGYRGITSSKAIKSAKTPRDDYEGTGIYFGVQGGYRGWRKYGHVIITRIPARNTFPILVNSRYPKPMAVALAEEISFETDNNLQLEPEKVPLYENVVDLREDVKMKRIEYFSIAERAGNIEPTEVGPYQTWMLKRKLKAKNVAVARCYSEEDRCFYDCVTLETTASPLICATAARCLGVPRLINLAQEEHSQPPTSEARFAATLNEEEENYRMTRRYLNQIFNYYKAEKSRRSRYHHEVARGAKPLVDIYGELNDLEETKEYQNADPREQLVMKYRLAISHLDTILSGQRHPNFQSARQWAEAILNPLSEEEREEILEGLEFE